MFKRLKFPSLSALSWAVVVILTGCKEPALPNACSTAFQSVAADCWLFDCADGLCGANST